MEQFVVYIDDLIESLEEIRDAAGYNINVGVLTLTCKEEFCFQDYLDIEIVTLTNDKGEIGDPVVAIAWPDIFEDNDPKLKLVK